jgi:hypothetical protein
MVNELAGHGIGRPAFSARSPPRCGAASGTAQSLFSMALGCVVPVPNMANMATTSSALRHFGDLNFGSAARMLRGSWRRALVHKRTLILPRGRVGIGPPVTRPAPSGAGGTVWSGHLGQ